MTIETMAWLVMVAVMGLPLLGIVMTRARMIILTAGFERGAE